MYARLMHPDRDFRVEIQLPNEADLHQDLELDRILDVMGRDYDFVRETCTAALLSPLNSVPEMHFRQAVLRDCLSNPQTFRDLYGLAFSAVRDERQHRAFAWRNSPESIVSSSVTILEFYTGELKRLCDFVLAHRAEFDSEAMRRLCDEFATKVTDEYLARVNEMLEVLRFKHGTLMSASLGVGNKGEDYLLLTQPPVTWWGHLREEIHSSEPSFDVDPRDEAGVQELSDLKGRGLNATANVVARAADHLRGFFTALLAELGFYIGCLNLHDALAQSGCKTCMPEPTAPEIPVLRTADLYETSLALKRESAITGNSFEAGTDLLTIVTGANRGGKSTFLRSLGQAQLMMQAGMFVAASDFSADIRDGVFTHFKRSEDDTMSSGKLDEELIRMGEITQQITPRSIILFNESFAATNEREGSEIARQITTALVESGVKAVFVTHLFEFASFAHDRWGARALFLRAPRAHNGDRDYKLVVGDPQPTSYGQDTYREIFEGATNASHE